jgi:protein associated with RNAse G/E
VAAASSGETGSITVRSCKFDGSLNRSWTAELVRREPTLIVLEGVFAVGVEHQWLGKIERGTRTREYFWTDRWYSVFRFLDDAGLVRLEYVNLNLPPTFSGSELTFVDLDIDLLIRPDGTCTVLDEDEFQTNADLYGYPAEIRAKVHETLSSLLELTRSGRFEQTVFGEEPTAR